MLTMGLTHHLGHSEWRPRLDEQATPFAAVGERGRWKPHHTNAGRGVAVSPKAWARGVSWKPASRGQDRRDGWQTAPHRRRELAI